MKRADYNPSEYFQEEFRRTEEQLEFQNAMSGTIENYRTKTTNCKRFIEVDVFPIHKPGAGRSKKKKRTKEEMREVNRKNAERKAYQQMNANFDRGDSIIHHGYESKYFELLIDETVPKKHFEAWVRRVKRLIDRVNKNFYEDRQTSIFNDKQKIITSSEYEIALDEYKANKRIKANFNIIARYISQHIDEPLKPLKYFCCIERNQKGMPHFHTICNFPQRERSVLAAFWKYGRNPKTDRCKPDEDFGLTGLGKYFTKEYLIKREFENAYYASTNLIKPHQKPHYTTNETKCTRKQAAEMAKDDAKMYAWFEKHYPGYVLLEKPVIKNNNEKDGCKFGGVYIYARLKKKE